MLTVLITVCTVTTSSAADAAQKWVSGLSILPSTKQAPEPLLRSGTFVYPTSGVEHMPQITESKRTIHTGSGGHILSSKTVSAEAARLAAIRTCLRELVGVDLIYAIRCPDGLIKIGHTRNLNHRRKHLDTAHDAILAVTPGTHTEEQALHATLRTSVGRGQEYYHPTPEVLAYVNGLRCAMGVEPIAA